jgi:hypothetical protein
VISRIARSLRDGGARQALALYNNHWTVRRGRPRENEEDGAVIET